MNELSLQSPYRLWLDSASFMVFGNMWCSPEKCTISRIKTSFYVELTENNCLNILKLKLSFCLHRIPGACRVSFKKGGWIWRKWRLFIQKLCKSFLFSLETEKFADSLLFWWICQLQKMTRWWGGIPPCRLAPLQCWDISI